MWLAGDGLNVPERSGCGEDIRRSIGWKRLRRQLKYEYHPTNCDHETDGRQLQQQTSPR